MRKLAATNEVFAPWQVNCLGTEGLFYRITLHAA